MNIKVKKNTLFHFALLAYFFLIACSSKPQQPPNETQTSPPQITATASTTETAQPPTATTSSVATVADSHEKATSSESVDKIKEDIKLILKKNGKPVENKQETHDKNKNNSHSSHNDLASVSPEKALGWLKNGNTRFVKKLFRNDGTSTKDVKRLAKGQHPHSIVLSCSDSRVPPEVVFDQKLGEIFVVRTAGETLDHMAIASIEYAVEHLGAKNIVVMGHQSCGAVKAALDTAKGGDAGSPALNALVADIHPRIKEFTGQSSSEGLTNESWANAKGVTKDLLLRSKIVKESVERGEVKISTSLYYLDSGKVEWAE